MGLIESEIKRITKVTNLQNDIVVLPFYAIIIRYYFLHKLGDSYKERIDRLIKRPFPDFER